MSFTTGFVTLSRSLSRVVGDSVMMIGSDAAVVGVGIQGRRRCREYTLRGQGDTTGVATGVAEGEQHESKKSEAWMQSQLWKPRIKYISTSKRDNQSKQREMCYFSYSLSLLQAMGIETTNFQLINMDPSENTFFSNA